MLGKSGESKLKLLEIFPPHNGGTLSFFCCFWNLKFSFSFISLSFIDQKPVVFLSFPRFCLPIFKGFYWKSAMQAAFSKFSGYRLKRFNTQIMPFRVAREKEKYGNRTTIKINELREESIIWGIEWTEPSFSFGSNEIKLNIREKKFGFPILIDTDSRETGQLKINSSSASP